MNDWTILSLQGDKMDGSEWASSNEATGSFGIPLIPFGTNLSHCFPIFLRRHELTNHSNAVGPCMLGTNENGIGSLGMRELKRTRTEEKIGDLLEGLDES